MRDFSLYLTAKFLPEPSFWVGPYLGRPKWLNGILLKLQLWGHLRPWWPKRSTKVKFKCVIMIVTPSTLQIEKSRVKELHFCHIKSLFLVTKFCFISEMISNAFRSGTSYTSELMARPESTKLTSVRLLPKCPPIPGFVNAVKTARIIKTSADCEPDKENLNKLFDS